MNWVNQLWLRIVSSDNGPLLDTIKQIKATNKTQVVTINELRKSLLDNELLMTQANHKILDFTNELARLEKQVAKNNMHSSVIAYKGWLDENIKPTPTYYNFNNDAKKRVHTIFKDSLKDETIIRNFIVEDVEFEPERYDTADKLVIAFCRIFSDKFPTRKYYKYDKDLYGTMEFWNIAKGTIEMLKTKGSYGDCDDVMTLKFSCLYYLLQDFFPEDQWRLRGFIVDIWTGGGHAMLGWVKEGVNDWVPIETTFYDSKQREIWNKNFVIRNQMLYKIRYSFDEKNEYSKI